MAAPLDLATILRNVQADDPTAFADLYAAYAGRIFAFYSRRLGDPCAAEDYTQELFFRLSRALPAFTYHSEPAFLAWLFRLARGILIDGHRRRVHRAALLRLIPRDEYAIAASEPGRQICERMALQQALHRLATDQQRVIYLRFVMGLTTAETAVALQRTLGATRVLQYRALHRLQGLLADADGD
jgi:RNA polymerase sigma-70 factor, ECF subfamily